MGALEELLADPACAGVFQLNREAREVARAGETAGLACFRIDIGHAHDKEDFLGLVSRALKFPDWFGHNWDALADCLKDLSWLPGAGFVLVLEKGKHFGAGHRPEFEQAMELLKDVSEYWRDQNRPFWALVGGPEGWNSGLPPMPQAR